MRRLDASLPTVVALAVISCVPKITITKTNGAYKATVNKNKFAVEPEIPFVVWKIDNKTGDDLAVTVDHFYLGEKNLTPLHCQGQPVKTKAHSKGLLACVVEYQYRADDPYCYSVCVDKKVVLDPQVIIKRDKGGRYDFLNSCKPIAKDTPCP